MAVMKYIKYSIILAFILPFAGCEDFDTLTKDPNRPTEVHPSLLLTSIETNVFNQISVGSAYASRYLVFTDGYSTDQTYGWQRSGFGGYNTLLQVYKMNQEAEKRKLNNYKALAKFFRAWQFTQMTQVFGDIPYSEALQGDNGIFKPKYDTQEQVYTGILAELKEANEMLLESNGDITGDIIYDGDILKWKKLINSFNLRVLMSLSAKEGNANLNVAARFREIYEDPDTYPIFTGLEDQAQLVFFDRDANRYPLFNDRSIQTANYMERTFVNLLKTRKDPRLFKFASPERKAIEVGQPGYQTSFSSFGGLDAGAYVTDNVQRLTEKGEGSPMNPRYYTDPVNEPSIAVGYPELQFNLAEAAFRGWITADTSDLYAKGIIASMQFYNIQPAKIESYLKETLVHFDPSKALEQINTQKYLSFFLNSGWESFYNQRRTGIPAFVVGPSTQNGGQIPKRWLYPQDELDNNFENVAEAINRQYAGNDDVNGVMWLLKPE
jgi:hypothetical protein